jgi:hypothetical protein
MRPTMLRYLSQSGQQFRAQTIFRLRAIVLPANFSAAKLDFPPVVTENIFR